MATFMLEEFQRDVRTSVLITDSVIFPGGERDEWKLKEWPVKMSAHDPSQGSPGTLLGHGPWHRGPICFHRAGNSSDAAAISTCVTDLMLQRAHLILNCSP